MKIAILSGNLKRTCRVLTMPDDDVFWREVKRALLCWRIERPLYSDTDDVLMVIHAFLLSESAIDYFLR